MEQEKENATLAVAKFSYVLNNFETTIRPLLSAIDTLRTNDSTQLTPLSRARLHITLSYTINTLFCMYLRTQGVDPATHPITAEIERVQDALMRLRKVEAGLSASHTPMPDRDRRKHIQNVEKNAARLSALVFPEEVELAAAIQNAQGRKRRREDDAAGKKKVKFTEKGIVRDRDEEIARKKLMRKERTRAEKKARKEAKRMRMGF